MGCNDSGQPPSGWSYHDDEKIQQMKARLDSVTAMLCESCRHMEADGGLYSITGLREWWEAHKNDDEVAELMLREQARREAIAEAEELEARARILRGKASR